MATIERRVRNDRVRWYARYRDPGGRQRTKTFNRKIDAERYLTSIESSKLAGTFVDPDRARMTFGALAPQWVAGKVNLKPTTKARYDSALKVHVLPRWSTTPLSRVDHAEIQAWVAQLSASGQSGASVRKSFVVLCGVLDLAVRARRIPANPAHGIDLPPLNEKRRRYLTAMQVEALAAASAVLPEDRPIRATNDAYRQYRLVVLVLAYCGLRWSELAALAVDQVDLTRRRVEVSRAVTEIDGGRLSWGTPKSHERRSVPLPSFLANELERHLANRPADALVFTAPVGGVLRNRTARRGWFDRAAMAIDVPGLTPHELRHTAASLAISAGANVKAVQRMLGHASAAMTLDRYADLFDDDLDEVAHRLDGVARSAGVYPLCTEADGRPAKCPSENGGGQ